MKIDTGPGAFRKDLIKQGQPNAVTMPERSFSDFMQQNDQRSSQEQLRKQLEQIDQQVEKLSKNMTVRELLHYRGLVKRFLEDTVRRGVAIKETRGWDRRGRGKRYKILDEVNAHLLGMADELIESEEGRLELLHRMGEIRGLLINLAF